MILEVDAGNSRIKWRLLDQQQVKVAEDAVLALSKTPSVFVELARQLDQLPVGRVSCTRVAEVRGAEFRGALTALMNEKWQLQPEFAQVERSCAGVTNSYEEPGRMGVDRWLALLAAFAKGGGPCCVVDCGSAVTLDLLDAQGHHRGGYIVPGLSLMRQALGERSAALSLAQAAEWTTTNLATATQPAVENGILKMLLSFLNGVHADRQDPALRWYLSGGDAVALSRLLEWPHCVEPELVLDGLALALQ